MLTLPVNHAYIPQPLVWFPFQLSKTPNRALVYPCLYLFASVPISAWEMTRRQCNIFLSCLLMGILSLSVFAAVISFNPEIGRHCLPLGVWCLLFLPWQIVTWILNGGLIHISHSDRIGSWALRRHAVSFCFRGETPREVLSYTSHWILIICHLWTHRFIALHCFLAFVYVSRPGLFSLKLSNYIFFVL